MAGAISSYQDLVAWQKAYAVGCQVYRVTMTFPRHELFGLTSQVRRAATSVALNIAEGYGRGSGPDYLRFLRQARGSQFELDTALMFATDFGYLALELHQSLRSQLQESERVLAGLIRSIEASIRTND
ncbi:MAG: four helix bundle protein [Phycisphaerales bacterium]|nr:four helix bundle protein [Phycisphaerales bacterium]